MTTDPEGAHDDRLAWSSPVGGGTRGLVVVGAAAGAGAAVGTSLVALVARAAGVSLEVDGQGIPIPAFAGWTIVGAALGIVLARVLRRRRVFVVVSSIGVAVSLIPAIIAPDEWRTAVVLVVTHLVAAAIIVPALSRQLILRQPSGGLT